MRDRAPIALGRRTVAIWLNRTSARDTVVYPCCSEAEQTLQMRHKSPACPGDLFCGDPGSASPRAPRTCPHGEEEATLSPIVPKFASSHVGKRALNSDRKAPKPARA